MRRYLSLLTACLFVCALFIPLLGASPGQAQSSSTSGFRIGMNIEQSLWANDNMYIDAFTIAGNWEQDDTQIVLGPNGYPTSAAGWADTYVWVNGAVAGTYNFFGKGDFTVDTFDLYGNIIPNTLVKGTAKNNWVTTCKVNVIPGTPGAQAYLRLIIATNPKDPDNPPSDFHLIPEEYPAWPETTATPGYPFTKQFLAALKPFSCLRFENWTCPCNGGPDVTTWASRPQPTAWGCAGAALCYENMITLCNLLNADMWLNIPTSAIIGKTAAAAPYPRSISPTDWMPNMAKLLASKLKGHVHYEIGDELWNWGYPFYTDWQRVDTLAPANPAVQFLSAQGPATGNGQYGAAGAWAVHGGEMGYLIALASETMQPYLGDKGRPILGAQFSGGYDADGLAYLSTIGKPSSYIYGVAYAPYNGWSSADPTPTDLNSLFKAINDYTTGTIAPTIKSEAAICKYYGVHMCCYEWGAQGVVPQGGPLATAAYQDPRMIAVVNSTANILKNAGVDVCNYYEFCEPYEWGLIHSMWYLQNNQTPPLYTGLAKLSASLKTVTAVPASSLTAAQEKAKEKAAAAAAKAAAEKAHHKH